MFDNLVDFIKKNYSWFTELHYVVRAVIFAFLVAVVGTLIVTMFSGAATHYYALGIGFKPPAEEIEALQTAILVWSGKLSLIILFGLTVVFAILMKFTAHKIAKQILFYVSFLAVLGFYGYISILLFNPSHYEALLKQIKIGGFTDIVLYENKIDKTEHRHECQLVLHATNSIVCYFAESKTYTQFPLINIQRIDYAVK